MRLDHGVERRILDGQIAKRALPQRRVDNVAERGDLDVDFQRRSGRAPSDQHADARQIESQTLDFAPERDPFRGQVALPQRSASAPSHSSRPR